MSEIDLTTPSRALDAAVAAAMGHTIWMTNVAPDGWALWDGRPVDHLYINTARGRIWLPRYSDPETLAYHRAAVLDMQLWLMERHTIVLDKTPDGRVLIDCNPDGWDASGETLALALCAAVVGNAPQAEGNPSQAE